jgi:hypothetical protein
MKMSVRTSFSSGRPRLLADAVLHADAVKTASAWTRGRGFTPAGTRTRADGFARPRGPETARTRVDTRRAAMGGERTAMGGELRGNPKFPL